MGASMSTKNSTSNVLTPPTTSTTFESKPTSTVISLDNFQEIPSTAIHDIHNLLKQQGFVFLTLPSSLSSLVTQCKPKLSQFFEKSTQEEKEKFTQPSTRSKNDRYGYNVSVDHKEGLRFLSGNQFDSKLVPTSCDPELSKLIDELDEAVIQLTTSLSPTVFGLSIEELATKYPLPLLNLKRKTTTRKRKSEDEKIEETSSSLSSFGMIDIAYYLNKKPLESGLNCVAHTDPGLFSFNILNTQPGLQFQNHEKKWIDGPVGETIGVLWCGDLAPIVSESKIPKCYHRVLFPSVSEEEVAAPRMSIWIELCTKDQELDGAGKMLNMVAEKDGVLILPSVPAVPSSDKIELKVPAAPLDYPLWGPQGEPMSSIPIRKGETLSSALSRASRQYGMPMTKMITYYCPICLDSVWNLEEHFNKSHKGKFHRV